MHCANGYEVYSFVACKLVCDVACYIARVACDIARDVRVYSSVISV